MGRAIRRVFAALGIAAVPLLFGDAAPAQNAPANCASGAPEGWDVIQEASGKSDRQVLCNYRIVRKLPTEQGPSQEFVSGTAITVEYYCNPGEAQQAFAGKTGKRDTETFRDSTKVVIEEGPRAANPDNPQRDGIRSHFFPDIVFEFFEKEWWLASQNTVMTLVVLTNEPAGKDRLGVDDAETVARSVAFANSPDTPGCQITPPPTVAPGGGAGGTKPGGSKTGTIIALVGGATVIVVGGKTIWTKKGSNKPVRPASEPVPEACKAHQEQYEDARNNVMTLREACQELSEELRHAETIHANNIIKANMLVGYEVGSVVGGTVADTASSLRPKGGGGRSPVDTWQPPSGLKGEMLNAIRKAREALDAAKDRVKRLWGEVDLLRNNLDGFPLTKAAVAQAKEAADILTKRLATMRERFAKATELRSKLDALEQTMDEHGKKVTDALRNKELLEEQLLDAQHALNNARSNLKLDMDPLQRRLKALKDDLTSLTPTVSSLDPNKTLDPDVLDGIERLQRSIDGVEDQIGNLSAGAQAQKIKDLETKITNLEGALPGARDHLRVMNEVQNRHMGDHQKALTEALKFEDATQAALDDVAKAQAAAKANYDTLHQQAYQEGRRMLEQMRKKAEKAEVDAAIVEAYLEAMQTRADAAAAAAASASGGGGASTWLWMPVTVLKELVFGTQQSPEEIMTILRTGKENIMSLTVRQRVLERSIQDQRSAAEALKKILDACVNANTAKRST